MKKSVLLAVLAATVMVAALPSYAATNSSGNSFGTKLKNGVMWGPRKIGAGFKKIGDKMHGNKTPKSK